MARLKSTSKGGQSLKKRAAESKGARKKELLKIRKVDSANFAKLSPAMKKKIKAKMARESKKKTKVKNKGKFI